MRNVEHAMLDAALGCCIIVIRTEQRQRTQVFPNVWHAITISIRIVQVVIIVVVVIIVAIIFSSIRESKLIMLASSVARYIFFHLPVQHLQNLKIAEINLKSKQCPGPS
jgi:hypothetical protein